MIPIDYTTELETERRLTMESAKGKPTWYATVASYIRHYKNDRHSATSELLPADRRITLALRRLYRNSSTEERAVMDGSSTLSGREKSWIFNRLCYLLAKEARITAAIILPPEYKHKDQEGDNES